jgi:hypothetical protein
MTLLIRPGGVKAVLFLVTSVLLGSLLLTVGGKRRGMMADPVKRHQKRGEELQQKIRAVTDRLNRKETVVKALLAGRLTLLEAAARFRALNEAPPEYNWDAFRLTMPGDSDDERHCHEVISFAFHALRRTDPHRADELHESLRAELRQHLGRGPLRLPEIKDHECEGAPLTPPGS